MLEKRRHQYLSILGIVQYIPKKSLAGAKPSIELNNNLMPREQAVPVSARLDSANRGSIDEEQQHLSGSEEDVEHSRQNTADNHDLIADGPHQHPDSKILAENLPLSNNSNIELIKPKPHAKSSETTNFVLRAWRVAEDCLVLDSRQPGTALPIDRLLQNILRLVGYPPAQLPPSETIRWPLFENDQNAQSKAQARAMVQAFVQAQHGKVPLKKLILMGEAATQFTLDEDPDQPFGLLCGTALFHSQWLLKIAIIPSLHAMLREPKGKAIAWKALRQLSAITVDH
ncbi:MAG: hypothetical protein ACJA04_000832 [Cellvibrionaceae bacterium]|jgi:hypothetical protein